MNNAILNKTGHIQVINKLFNLIIKMPFVYFIRLISHIPATILKLQNSHKEKANNYFLNNSEHLLTIYFIEQYFEVHYNKNALKLIIQIKIFKIAT